MGGELAHTRCRSRPSSASQARWTYRVSTSSRDRSPFPRGERPEAQAAIRADFDAALPFLAASAIEAVPSREEDVYRGLARLELEVCEELLVRYELNGEVHERGEAVAFIAVRQEQAGIVRRNIGTAHLELDPSTGKPHWYVFGPLLARFLNVPTQDDAFSLLLSGSSTSRREYLRSRLIPGEALEEARIRLDQPPLDDDLTDLIGDLEDYDDGPTDEGDPTTPGDEDESGLRSGTGEAELLTRVSSGSTRNLSRFKKSITTACHWRTLKSARATPNPTVVDPGVTTAADLVRPARWITNGGNDFSEQSDGAERRQCLRPRSEGSSLRDRIHGASSGDPRPTRSLPTTSRASTRMAIRCTSR